MVGVDCDIFPPGMTFRLFGFDGELLGAVADAVARLAGEAIGQCRPCRHPD